MYICGYGGMADAQDSKSCGGDLVWVQVPLSALNLTERKPETLELPAFSFTQNSSFYSEIYSSSDTNPEWISFQSIFVTILNRFSPTVFPFSSVHFVVTTMRIIYCHIFTYFPNCIPANRQHLSAGIIFQPAPKPKWLILHLSGQVLSPFRLLPTLFVLSS